MEDAPLPAVLLSVPLQVDARAANNWDEAHLTVQPRQSWARVHVQLMNGVDLCQRLMRKAQHSPTRRTFLQLCHGRRANDIGGDERAGVDEGQRQRGRRNAELAGQREIGS